MSAGDGRTVCPRCRQVSRTRGGVIRPHWSGGKRCDPDRAAIPPAANRCAHTSTMRLGDRRVCADCGEPRP